MGNQQQVRQGVFNNFSKTTEKLGKDTNSSVAFDDFDFVKDKFNYRLAEVKIWHDSNYIVGIQCIYNMDGQNKSPGSHQGSAKTKCDSIILFEGEFITKIVVRSGSIIDGIGLYTNKGRSLTVGGTGGSITEFVFNVGSFQFISFGGSTSKYLDSFQATYGEIY